MCIRDRLSFVIEEKIHTHTHTFRKLTFFHVLSVVESESAIISNTIFLPSPYFHFLKEHGSKNGNLIDWFKMLNVNVAVGFNLFISVVITH